MPATLKSVISAANTWLAQQCLSQGNRQEVRTEKYLISCILLKVRSLSTVLIPLTAETVDLFAHSGQHLKFQVYWTDAGAEHHTDWVQGVVDPHRGYMVKAVVHHLPTTTQQFFVRIST